MAEATTPHPPASTAAALEGALYRLALHRKSYATKDVLISSSERGMGTTPPPQLRHKGRVS